MYLAKLAHFFAPAVVAARKIFDADLAKYAAHGLHFRHTDNINYFLQVQDRSDHKYRVSHPIKAVSGRISASMHPIMPSVMHRHRVMSNGINSSG